MELVDESLSYDVKPYIHRQSKDDLRKKKTILKFLADNYAPQKGVLKSINNDFAGKLSRMFNKFIRHNNDDNPYIKGLTPEELEACYDDIYYMWLLASMEIDHYANRKDRITSLIENLNG